jgi:hypothetical protein
MVDYPTTSLGYCRVVSWLSRLWHIILSSLTVIISMLWDRRDVMCVALRLSGAINNNNAKNELAPQEYSQLLV